MSTPIPRPTLDQALERLQTMDEFKTVVNYLKMERELMLSDFSTLDDEKSVMKHVGGISRLDEVIRLME